MSHFDTFRRGMGVGGWLTNYKRFHVLPPSMQEITVGDLEHFRTYITEWDARNIARMGFDHVRLGFDQIVLEEEPYRYREEIVGLMERFVLACRAEGMGVVLNLHKAIGSYCDVEQSVSLMEDAPLQDRVIALWEMLEDRFHGDGGIAFELLNEVTDVDPELWNRFSDRMLAAIRRKNPERTVIIGSVYWNYPRALKHLRVSDDENVVYTFHNYEPFEFTHQQGVLQKYPMWYNRKLVYPCDDVARYSEFYTLRDRKDPYSGLDRIDRRVLENAMADVVGFRRAHPEKILWCGEFGTIRHADAQSRINYMRDSIAFFRENGIPYCVWNYLSTPNDGNRFSLVDDDTREILSPELLRALLGE